MHRKLLAITAGALTGFLLVGAITLLPALASSRVAPATDGAIVYVDDDTCPAAGSGTDVDPYCRIQDAVDTVAEGGEVRVAAGTYTGSQMVVDTRTGYTYTQVVFVDKDLTLRGGYDAADWAADPDPVANPTVIDAQRSGRGVSIVGTVSDNPLVTLDGFTITGGDYTGLHNAAEYYYDRGGGLYARRSGLSLLNCTVVDNIGGRHKHSEGGGIYIQEIYNEVLIENTSVISNSTPGSSGYGAGIFISGAYAPITITRSVIQDNHASHAFAAIALYSGDAPLTFTETDVRGNRTETHGIVYLQLSTDTRSSVWTGSDSW
ncbi:MAG: right-handed parallel beta-helix repeat-containing protein, partial [Anaerolineae bacterium]